MEFNFKHGSFSAKLNICNRSFFLASVAFNALPDVMKNDQVSSYLLLQKYAYYSYQIQAAKDGVANILSCDEFEELITVKQDDSNLPELLVELGNSISSQLDKGESDDKKKEVVT